MSILTKQATDELELLRERGLYRAPLVVEKRSAVRAVIGGREVTLFSSNDYLGLSHHVEVVSASIEATRRWGTGAGASRLVSGNLSLYGDLERALADLMQTEAAVVFASGYAANIGMIPAFATEEDVILSDELNHASIVDACRLSRAKKKIFLHRDMEVLEQMLRRCARYRRRFVITEGIFSVDGDISPLRDIVDIARRYEASLILDDAHAIGVLGESGGGTVEHFGLDSSAVDVRLGTLSKAVGCVGGFIGCPQRIAELLFNRARSLIYSTALPPGNLAAATTAVRLLRSAKEQRSHLVRIASHVRATLTDMGFNIGSSQSHIIPVIIGDERKTLEFSFNLLQRGVFVPALRPPTVPPKSSRLRISLSACHTEADVEVLLTALKDCLRP